jgi:hypothetical protein
MPAGLSAKGEVVVDPGVTLAISMGTSSTAAIAGIPSASFLFDIWKQRSYARLLTVGIENHAYA